MIISSLKPLKIVYAAASSVCFILSFPDYNLFFLAWIFLVPLFRAIDDETPLNAFYIGWFSGILAFAGTVYWVTNSMTNYGGINPVLSIFFLFLLSAYLGLYTGLFCLVYRESEIKLGTLPALSSAPFLWVSLEYLRGHLLTGFPWSLIGYSQWDMTSFIQVADITGIYGISFALIALNAVIYYVFSPASSIVHLATLKKRALILFVPFVMLLSFWIYGKSLEGTYKDSALKDRALPEDSVNVAVVQGNIEQSLKWERGEQIESIETHKKLTERSLDCTPSLVVWPETALPFYLEKEPAYLQAVSSFAKERNIYLLAGSVGFTKNQSGRDDVYNSAFLISADGKINGRYDKRHLVPFGEYIPLEWLFRITYFDRIIGDIGSFSVGSESRVFKVDKGAFSAIICYELIFPELVRTFVSSGGELLVNITNEGWFGRSSAAEQHFTNAVFRAIENRVYVIRSANTGISGFISPAGEVLQKTEMFEPASFCRKVYFSKVRTFYTRFGDIFAFSCIALSLLFLILPAGKNPDK